MRSRNITGALMAVTLSLVPVATMWGQEETASPGAAPMNHPPTVKIVTPKANGAYEENARVRYEIDVSDREDGAAKFQEINSTAVLLVVRHFPSAEAAEAATSRAIADDAPGLGTLR